MKIDDCIKGMLLAIELMLLTCIFVISCVVNILQVTWLTQCLFTLDVSVRCNTILLFIIKPGHSTFG